MASLIRLDSPYSYAGTVLAWHDGDTCLARLDLGFRVWWEGWIRIAGLWCPELKELGGEAALEAAKEIAPIGSAALFRSRQVWSFSRIVGDITVPIERDFAGAMIEEGAGSARP